MAGRADWIAFSGLSSLCSLVHIGGFVWANSVGPGKVVPLHRLCKQRIGRSCCLVASLSKSLWLQHCTLRPRDSTLAFVSPAAWFRSVLQQLPSAPSAPIQRQSVAFLRRQGKLAECWLVSVSPWLRLGHSGTTGVFLFPPYIFLSHILPLSITPTSTAHMKPGHAPSEQWNRQLPVVGLEGPDLKRNLEK